MPAIAAQPLPVVLFSMTVGAHRDYVLHRIVAPIGQALLVVNLQVRRPIRASPKRRRLPTQLTDAVRSSQDFSHDVRITFENNRGRDVHPGLARRPRQSRLASCRVQCQRGLHRVGEGALCRVWPPFINSSFELWVAHGAMVRRSPLRQGATKQGLVRHFDPPPLAAVRIATRVIKAVSRFRSTVPRIRHSFGLSGPCKCLVPVPRPQPFRSGAQDFLVERKPNVVFLERHDDRSPEQNAKVRRPV